MQIRANAREHDAGDRCIHPRRNIVGTTGHCPVCGGCGPLRFAVVGLPAVWFLVGLFPALGASGVAI